MAKIQIKPKSNLHFLLGKDEKTGTRVELKAGVAVEVDTTDIVNLDKKDYDVVTVKEAEKKT
jgi:hypothetical protein